MKSSRWNNKRRKTLESIALEAGKVGLAAGVLAAKGAFKAAKIGYRLSTDYCRWTTATPRRSIHTLVGASLLLGVFSGYPETSYSSPHAEANAVEEVVEYKNWNGPLLFADAEANKVAVKKGIHPGNYMIFDEITLEKLTGLAGSDLLPVFPPSVISKMDTIKKLSDETGIPPNVIAGIMSIESGGNERAQSNLHLSIRERAQGACQVMPLHFIAKYGDGILRTPEKMLDLYTGCKLGMDFLAELVEKARKELPQYPENSGQVWGRAFVGYNGGGSSIPLHFSSLAEESKFYGDNAVRLLLDAEIAAGLRNKGYSDSEIVKAMKSAEVDARVYALNHYISDIRGRNGMVGYGEYHSGLRLLSTPFIGQEAQTPKEMRSAEFLQMHYEYFLANPDAVFAGYPYFMFEFPLSPGFRIFASLGGVKLLDDASPENRRLSAYSDLRTSRN